MGISFGKNTAHGIEKATMALVSAMTKTKIRRSLRLVERCTKEEVAPPFSELGNFSYLPTEVVFKIFENLTLSALGMVSISSKALRNHVLTYVCLHSTIQNRFPDRKLLHSQVASSCRVSARMTEISTKLGFLIKRLSCLFPTKTRIQLVIEKVLPQFDCNRQSNHCTRGALCEAPALLGEFVQAMAAGWVLSELITLVRLLSDTPMGSGGAAGGLMGPPGAMLAVLDCEPRWRRFHRLVYLDPSNTLAGEIFWLMAILQLLEPDMRGRTLFALYGPCADGELRNRDMSTSPILSPVRGRAAFLELTRVLAVMDQHSEGNYTNAKLVPLVENMISRPQRWLPVNVAQLLFFCRKELVVGLLTKMLNEGKVRGVARIVATLTLVNLSVSDNVNWLLELVEKNILPFMRNRFQLRTLYRHINDAFEAETTKIVEMISRGEAALDVYKRFARGINLFQTGITQMPFFKTLI